MKQYRVDLHVHIGRDSRGEPVKISAARDLVFKNIAQRAHSSAGVQMVGIVDCASPRVLRDISELLDSGHMSELEGGGIAYSEGAAEESTVIIGAELEASLPEGCSAHYMCFMPSIRAMQDFSSEVKRLVSNIDLSTQHVRMSPTELAKLTHDLDGLFVPSHVFTPHKGVLGACVPRIEQAMSEDGLELVNAIELGLSADTAMADTIAELAQFTFLSNSDAHSLPRIGREFNVMDMERPTFSELALALARRDGRGVRLNYGLDPRLGKYHLSGCDTCGARFSVQPGEPRVCPKCASHRVVVGVADRLAEIADHPTPHSPPHRPEYRYQVPLQFIPGIGPARIKALVREFGSELAALHDAPFERLARVVGDTLAGRIIDARSGALRLDAGGGGAYGRVSLED
ncbi:MAG: endonuclease Q family protein [Bacillota bacterium]|nr:TIGR00375 family protein [Bacillota bacterium]